MTAINRNTRTPRLPSYALLLLSALVAAPLHAQTQQTSRPGLLHRLFGSGKSSPATTSEATPEATSATSPETPPATTDPQSALPPATPAPQASATTPAATPAQTLQTSQTATAQQPTAATAQQTTPPAAPAQSAPDSSAAPADQPITTIKVQVNEVNLVFTVTDKKGHFITGLKRENFGLLDDGREPVAVLRFTQQTNLPLRVGIMLDTSSSIRQRFQFEQDSAIEFLLQILHLNDRAFVEGFDIETDLSQGFTNNIDLLNKGIRKLRPGGGTALFDALYKTCKDQMLTLQETGAVRRAIILVSDGDDNYSRVEESDAIKMCQRADTIVYTISTNVSPSKDKGDDVLKAISEATGGQPFYPIKLEDVSIGFRNIEEELRSQTTWSTARQI